MLFATSAWAQEFRCIVPEEDRFFMDATMLGLRIRNSDTLAEGILHQFHYDLRPVAIGDPTGCNTAVDCDDFGFTDAYFTLFGASWMGPNMLEMSNGSNLFFNVSGDTIVVNTLAELNESWTVFNWSDTATLEATVTSITTETVLGTAQSVKTIAFQAYDSSGAEMNHPLNEAIWKLSQFEGFTQVHSLHWFPDFPDPATQEAYQCRPYSYAGHEHYSIDLIQLTDQRPPSEGEMYAMEVGDEFQIKGIMNSWNPYVNYYRYTLIDKSFVGNAMTLVLSKEAINTNAETVAFDTITILSADTSNIFPNDILPGQTGSFLELSKPAPLINPLFNSFDANSREILDSLSLSCYFRIVEVDDQDNLSGNSLDCVSYYSQADGTYGPRVYFSGIPVPASVSSGLSGVLTHFPIYVNTTTCQFGSRMYVGMEEHNVPMALHPNPTSSVLGFESREAAAYSIIDIMGHIAQRGIAQMGHNTIKVSALPEGIYLLRLDGAPSAARFVKTGP
jgi:hypothetical protein